MNTRDKRARTPAASIWKNPDYVLLWAGQTLSTIGGSISQLAFPLLLLYLTKSPAAAGIAGALRIAPEALLGIFAGALVDRWNRKRIMIVCDADRAISLASIPVAAVLGHLTVFQLYLNALVEGVLVTFFFLAYKACLRNVVTKEQLPAAVGQQEVIEGVNTLFGPLLGGVLFGISQMLSFVADAASYIVSVVTLSLIRAPFQQERYEQRGPILHDIADGFRWLRKQPLIQTMTLFYAATALVAPGFSLIFIVLLQSEHASPSTIGLVFGIGGIGSLLGALIGSRIQRRTSFGQAILGVRWLTVGILFCFALTSTPVAVAVVLFLLLLVEPTEDIVYFSYRTALMPDALQGRIVSATRTLTRTASSVAPAIVGFLLQATGVTHTILLCGALFLVITVLLTLSPTVRNTQPIVALEQD